MTMRDRLRTKVGIIKRKWDDFINRHLVKAFFNCGDNALIEFAMVQARLNRIEREVIRLMIDECRTQEETAELMELSTRKVQQAWTSATGKLLSLRWLVAYAKTLDE